ncbi:MAG: 50S ribosomal protein L11 methyltransferase, partial [Solirubrobacteraceae bacterium]
ENAARNGVAVETRLLDMRHEQVPGADLVVANVLAPPLIAWAGAQRTLAPALILSGLLAGEADRVAEAFGAHGVRELERRESGEWAALMLARASDSLPM